VIQTAASRVLGRLLLTAGAVTAAQVDAALAEQRRTGERLGEVLVRRGTAPEAVARALAEQLRLPYAPPPLQPRPDALRLLDRRLARRLRIVPLDIDAVALRAAVADPLDAGALDDLRFRVGRRIDPVVATPGAVDDALDRAYDDPLAELVERLPAAIAGTTRDAASHAGGQAGNGATGDAAHDAAGDGVSPAEDHALRRASEAPPIVALVDHLLRRADALRASDIHVEPAEDALRVRARVDGVLRPVAALPATAAPAIVSRLKIMAGLDIAVKRRPQDGRSRIRVGAREVALRVSTLPAGGGEKVVLRLLDPRNAGGSLDELGMDDGLRARFARLLGRGHGVLLVTGPTGSGKTTTLYAALAALDRERRNVLTLEDPVEYRLQGLTQVQVHPRAGLSFAAGLRAALRQDPDVIMVGEMRDRETVEVGMAAALTGHLVLSTLHTNDAPGGVARLTEMKAPPYLVAGGLIGILAQRLARRLCSACRRPRAAEPEELAALGLGDGPAATTPVPSAGAVPPADCDRPGPGARARAVAGGGVTLHDPGGCDACGGTGYRGRIGVYELLVVDTRIRELVLRRAPADAIREAARAAGMVPMSHDAWTKVRAGLTSVAEVAPLLALMADEAPACPACAAPIRAAFHACPACGATLRRRCPCGCTLERGWRWCPACGAAAARPAERPPTTPSPQLALP
jgi:type IV pilus assembly protein PilB